MPIPFGLELSDGVDLMALETLGLMIVGVTSVGIGARTVAR